MKYGETFYGHYTALIINLVKINKFREEGEVCVTSFIFFKKIIFMFYSRGFVRVRFVNYNPCIVSALSYDNAETIHGL